LKFGTQMHRGNISKIRKDKSRKGAWPRSRDPHKFWRTPNISTKRVELETSKLVHRCRVAISQKPAKKNLKKGRGIGHVTLIRLSHKPVNISANHCLIFLNSIEAKLMWKLLIKQQIFFVVFKLFLDC